MQRENVVLTATRLGAARQSRTLHALGGFYSPEAVDLEPGVDSVAAGERLRVRSASRPLHSQSLSPVGTLSDSWSPSLQGDKVSLQLRGDIILEHLQCVLTEIDIPQLSRVNFQRPYLSRDV